MNAVQGLKVLAAVMGVLIIGAIGLLGYGVYSKLGGSGKGETVAEGPETPAAPPVAETAAAPAPTAPTAPTAPAAPVAQAALAPAGPLDLDQPEGSRIVGASTNGALLTLHLAGGGLPDRVAVVDLRDGNLVRWVHIGAAPIPAPAR